jgi:hypothetical protein
VNTQVSGSTQPLKRTPKWRREIRLVRRDGLRKYVRCARSLHRFHRSVRRMERLDGYDY